MNWQCGLLSKCQIKWKIVSNFCGLFRISELYLNGTFRINGQFQIFNPTRCLISKHCISDIFPYSKVQKWKLTCLLNIFSMFPFLFCINPKINSWSAFPFLSLQEGTLFSFWAMNTFLPILHTNMKWYRILKILHFTLNNYLYD